MHVYQESLRFVAWVSVLLEAVPKSLAVYNQMDRASTSIPLNIAEGTAKFTAADKNRFYDVARGSAVECAACLDVLVVKQIVKQEDVFEGKNGLLKIVAMLVRLIRSSDTSRFREDAEFYCGTEDEQ